jgi:Gamma tubulin complex component N-terminal
MAQEPRMLSDPSLCDLVERVLPLATYYTAISSFIELRGHLDLGRVNHALCAALRDMLKVCLHAPLQFYLTSLDNIHTGIPDSSFPTRTRL